MNLQEYLDTLKVRGVEISAIDTFSAFYTTGTQEDAGNFPHNQSEAEWNEQYSSFLELEGEEDEVEGDESDEVDVEEAA